LRAGKKEITHREIGVGLNLAAGVTRDQRHSTDATKLFLARVENYATDVGIEHERWRPKKAERLIAFARELHRQG